MAINLLLHANAEYKSIISSTKNNKVAILLGDHQRGTLGMLSRVVQSRKSIQKNIAKRKNIFLEYTLNYGNYNSGKDILNYYTFTQHILILQYYIVEKVVVALIGALFFVFCVHGDVVAMTHRWQPLRHL